MSQVISQEYYDALLQAQKEYRAARLKFPLYEFNDSGELVEKPIINIDLNTRKLILPERYDKDAIINYGAEEKGFLSMQRDHYAEHILFKVNRYFEDLDLFYSTIVVEYQNISEPKAVPGLFPVMLKDIDSEPGFMYLAWCINNDATQYAGDLKFAVRFYNVNTQERKFIYNLSTLPAIGEILYGMEETDWDDPNHGKVTPTQFELLLDRIEDNKYQYWTDV